MKSMDKKSINIYSETEKGKISIRLRKILDWDITGFDGTWDDKLLEEKIDSNTWILMEMKTVCDKDVVVRALRKKKILPEYLWEIIDGIKTRIKKGL